MKLEAINKKLPRSWSGTWSRAVFVCAIATALIGGCRVAKKRTVVRPPRAPEHGSPSGTTTGNVAQLGTELSAANPIVELAVQDHLPAVISLPVGARAARPVLVAAHGAGDRPEWQCEYWRRIVGNRAFVACPRGAAIYPYGPPQDTGYYYRGHPALGQEISCMLEALRARYPEYVDLREPVFAGYSQGAIMGALLLANHPARFARAVLIEGGYGGFQEWNIAVARQWQHQGAQRVLMACGRLSCVQQARLTAYYFRRGGLAARILYAAGAGHTYSGNIEKQVREEFDWLVRDDARWFLSRPGPPPESQPAATTAPGAPSALVPTTLNAAGDCQAFQHVSALVLGSG